jgi:hypothetical protein
MTTNVPTPPDGEKTRQQLVHSLRAQRVRWARMLSESDFTDKKAASMLVEVNAKIDILKYLRTPIDAEDEPSLEEITNRGLNWYWEDWSDLGDEDDD